MVVCLFFHFYASLASACWKCTCRLLTQYALRSSLIFHNLGGLLFALKVRIKKCFLVLANDVSGIYVEAICLHCSAGKTVAVGKVTGL